MPMGMPGWPELAFWTASMARARTALARGEKVDMKAGRRKGEVLGTEGCAILADRVGGPAGRLGLALPLSRGNAFNSARRLPILPAAPAGSMAGTRLRRAAATRRSNPGSRVGPPILTDARRHP